MTIFSAYTKAQLFNVFASETEQLSHLCVTFKKFKENILGQYAQEINHFICTNTAPKLSLQFYNLQIIYSM